jgi:hypothetical protein
MDTTMAGSTGTRTSRGRFVRAVRTAGRAVVDMVAEYGLYLASDPQVAWWISHRARMAELEAHPSTPDAGTSARPVRRIGHATGRRSAGLKR